MAPASQPSSMPYWPALKKNLYCFHQVVKSGHSFGSNVIEGWGFWQALLISKVGHVNNKIEAMLGSELRVAQAF
jgi:hypothetical protein